MRGEAGGEEEGEGEGEGEGERERGWWVLGRKEGLAHVDDCVGRMNSCACGRSRPRNALDGLSVLKDGEHYCKITILVKVR